ncbi:MAG: right-handed parallel beta-helix repeat-containing protein [Caldimonas sp.]
MTTHPVSRFVALGTLALRGGVGILGMALFAALLAACGGQDFRGATTEPAPTIAAFAATPASQTFGGGQVVLSWTSADASTLVIDHGVGDVSGLTSKAVNVGTSTTFTLTASNAAGTATATTAVAVAAQPAPVITTFTATPAALPVGGGAVTLSWATSDATSLAIDNGVGAVTGTSTVVNVSANTTFTLTATNTAGTVTKTSGVTLAGAATRFIDVATGLDTNPCTQAAPCKSLTHALVGAPAGSTFLLADGVYDRVTENSNGVFSLPDGATLQAMHPGAATLASLFVNALGSATFNGIVIDRQSPAFLCSQIGARSSTGAPTLTLIGVSSNCANWLQVSGSVKATMTPGALPGGAYTTGLAATGGQILVTGPAAELLIQGGVFEGSNNPSLAAGHNPLLVTSGLGTLTLDGVTVRNWKQAVASTSGGTLILRNGTLIDKVGESIGNFGNGCAILVGFSGTASLLTMDHATLSNAADAGICVQNNLLGAVTDRLQFAQSTISGSAGAAIQSEFSQGFGAAITADGLTLADNGWGIYWTGRSGGSFDIKNSTISGSTKAGGIGAGIYLSGTSAASFKLRGSTVSGGAQDGVYLYNVPSTTIDLGTTADPGGNTFTGNASTGLHIVFTPGQTVIDAVGNTWAANQQGADANGRYSLPPAFLPVPKAGPTGGLNFKLDTAGTLNL